MCRVYCAHFLVFPTLYYYEFPFNWIDVYKKWYRNSVNTVCSGQMKKQQILYALLIPTAIIVMTLSSAFFYSLVFLYIIGRGFLSPISKSKKWNWWKGNCYSIIFAPVAGLIIDIAKYLGYMKGFFIILIKNLN